MPRRATFLARGGMRMVMARLPASLKSAISLAPLRSRPGPSRLSVTSITIGRRSRTLPPRQSSTSPAANLARSASSKPAASVSLLWARAGAAAAVAVAEAAARNLRRVVRIGGSVLPQRPSRRVTELWLAGRELTGPRTVPSVWPVFSSSWPGRPARWWSSPWSRSGPCTFMSRPTISAATSRARPARFSGRKTTIAEISIDWGFDLARPSERRCRSPMPTGPRNPTCSRSSRSTSSSACGLCSRATSCCRSLELRKPEVVVEKGEQEQIELELGEAPAAAAPPRRWSSPTTASRRR